MYKHLRHQTKFDGTVNFVYPGGIYKNKKSVFEDLKEVGTTVSE